MGLSHIYDCHEISGNSIQVMPSWKMNIKMDHMENRWKQELWFTKVYYVENDFNYNKLSGFTIMVYYQ